MGSDQPTIEEELSLPIQLADRIRQSAKEAESFKQECSELARQLDRLAHTLRSTVRLATSSLYEPPVRRIVAEVVKALDRALSLVRKCRRSGVLRRVVTITSAADFKKVQNLLDASIADVNWLLSVFESATDSASAGGGIVLSMPPIASNDPILSWVWSYLAVIQMSSSLPDRVEAANELAAHAYSNDRNKKIIVEEGGIPPLLRLLKETSSADAQVAAASALANLTTDEERVRLIVAEHGVPIIVQVLWDAPISVQISVANLVSRMAENDHGAQEEFARENAIRPLVSLLLTEEALLDDPKDKVMVSKPTSLHSLVQYNKELGGNAHLYSKTRQNYYPNSHSMHSEGGGRGGHHKKDRENEKPEVKSRLKVKCAEALWLLSKGSVANSQRITETKGLLCLAKYVEKEKGELQFNCLMTVAEIARAAESNADLRRTAFKTNSPAAKAVVDQLLRVIQEEDVASLLVPAIRAIGSLARTFQARETRVIGPLVARLDHRDLHVSTEAIVSLGKFACPENFLCVQHSKAIIGFGGVPPLMRLLRLRSSEHGHVHGLMLLCYLALHVGSSEDLEEWGVLSALKRETLTSMSQHLLLRDLIQKAIDHLELYQQRIHPHRPSYSP